MCTVTIVPLGPSAPDGFRLACNRDESTLRPAALPPRRVRIGDHAAVIPIDPVSGGTWIGVNDAGIVMVLLNASRRPGASSRGSEPAAPRRSRGLIIPALLDCDSLDRVRHQAMTAIEPDRFAPFRLIAADGEGLLEVRSDGSSLAGARGPLGPRPRIFTSSGLGDSLVEGPRTRLFTAFFLAEGDRAGLQDSFHRHSWADRPHLSVCMRRPGAATVSCTVVETRPGSAVVRYQPGPPDLDPPSAVIRLATKARSGARPRLRSSPWEAIPCRG